MYNTRKSLPLHFLLISSLVCVFSAFVPSVSANENYENFPFDPNTMLELESESMSLPFNPNDYNFLIYDPNGEQSGIRYAMKIILGRDLQPNEIRTWVSGNRVTLNDLQTHDILICGWNRYGHTDGLDPSILISGITGKVILTGHDLDWHEPYKLAAKTMLIQSINYVLQGGGCGLITLGDDPTQGNPFSYLPSSWGVSATSVYSDYINKFTMEGIKSGIYDSLLPDVMSNWNQSYHNTFSTSAGSPFIPFEIGGTDGDVNVTIARTKGYYSLTKILDTNEGNYISAGQDINFIISFNANGHSDVNVKVIDFLPAELNYISSNPSGDYNSPNRTVTWYIGTISGNNSYTYTLRAHVNNLVDINGYVLNVCKIQGDHTRDYARCYAYCQPGIIYVNSSLSDGNNTGTSWVNAYTDLQNAFYKASLALGTQIWVAKGPYTPTVPSNDPTFSLIDNIPLYGHFEGNETSINQRRLKDSNDESILSSGEYTVIMASNLNHSAAIDGFNIIGTEKKNYGINCTNSNLTVKNCLCENYCYGISATESNFIISDCIIRNNHIGLDLSKNTSESTIEKNIIYNNDNIGIQSTTLLATIKIKNNILYRNYWHGMLFYSNSLLIFHNNTVAKSNRGIYINGSPFIIDIKNCIFWDNEKAFDWFDPNDATYCCIQGDQQSYPGTGNIYSDPCFVDPNADNFHLLPNSPCVDKGNPAFNDFNDLDIDGESRIVDGNNDGNSVVDIGADEVSWPKADYNGDEIVNFFDFAEFVDAWQSINNPTKSLDADNDVDINDLDLFCDKWLWIPPWSPNYGMQSQQQEEGSQMSGDMNTNESLVTDGTTITDESMNNDMEENESQMPEGPAVVWLTYDGNMTPNYGDEITVYVHSDANLMIMDLYVNVAGDANITSAMSEEDCNNFGWDNGWGSDPYFDESGWVEVHSMSASAFFEGKLVNGTVGYFKFRYYSGQVNVSISDGWVVDNNIEDVAFSTEPLIFGPDPNE